MRYKLARILYKKLLSLYPQAFREQLGESMEQTFNDLCHERNRQPAQGGPGFMLWIFIETAIGILREHILFIKQGIITMKNSLTTLKAAGLISLLLILPFMVLEFLFNILNKPAALNPKNLTGLIFLFGLMWLLPTLFIALLTPVVRNTQAQGRLVANPISLLFRVAFLVLIAMMWGGLVMDQLPCFLGVPNCD